MNPFPRRAAWPAIGLLAAFLLAVPAAPADDAKVKASAPLTAEDKAKQIAELEKQIADLQKKLEEAKKAPTSPAPAPAESPLPDSLVKRMNWRPIGPANMAGRITAIAVNESDPTTYYVATASGGLLKTTNNGTTFTHTFDNQPTVSIGDVAVAPSNPDVVWVGTGENNPRNSVSYGDGVYKSTDGGKTWNNVGLKQSYSVGKILVHPKDPNTVYVGAMGRVYGPNPERGVFKTTDGGKTWNKVLFVDDKTGAIDMRLDPNDPESLLVGMWERKRDEFDGFFGPPTNWPTVDQYGPAVTYGPGGGLFKTSDGGKTWKKLTDEKAKTGLPTVKTGRIGIDYSHKTKGLVYAIIDTEKVGMGRAPLSVYMGLSSDTAKDGGVKVETVYEDSPASKAGLKEGDVITAADGKKVADYDAFMAYIATKKPKDVVKLTLRRGDKELTVEMTLDPRPADEGGGRAGGGGGGGGAGGRGQGGMMLLPGFVPEVNFEGPVKVASVPKDGPAEKAGVKPGMTVTAVDGNPVNDYREFVTELRALPRFENARKAGDKVKVKFTGLGDKPVEVELALVMMEVQPPAGNRSANPTRPFLMSNQIGGQRPNVQDQQGKDGYQTGGVYVSKDGGETWTRVNSLNPRPFYFSNVRVDPNDDNRVWVLGDTTLWLSVDGGKKFAAGPSTGVHPDHHALWINPKDSRHMLIGCDGGFYVTYDKGTTWDHLNTLALGQFYHVATDTRRPYRVYGGLQDNGSWGGPSHVLRGTGPVNEDWFSVGGGDGFVCRVDPTDPDLVYSESQNGFMGRRNYRTGERASIRPRPVKEGEELRFNWNTPFILSSHNPSIFYCGAQYVFRSVQKGDNLKPISPELTRTKQGSLTAIAESPRNPEVLWAGSDDGYLWVTRDGGLNWKNVTEYLKPAGLPGPRWVSSIEPSRTKEGKCYVVLDAHRSDDDKPYVFVTEDYGLSWKSLAANLPAFGSTRVLREDIVNPNLLYLGTEFAVWASVDAGGSWTKISNNLPTVAIHEVAQPTTASEIVVATHGRSLWVLDVASLRQITADALKEPAKLFAPAAATRWKLESRGENPYSRDVRKFYGVNPYRGATIDYHLAQPAKDVSIKVTDVTGKTVREFRGTATPAAAGFHRVQWELGRGGGGGGGGGGFGGGGAGGLVPAGAYRVVLTVDGKEFVQPLTVENDPNADPRALITPEAESEKDEEGREKDPIRPFIPLIKD